MRYLTSWQFVAFVFLVGLMATIIFSSESENDPLSETQEQLNKQYPGEWFYNEKAYPNNFINVRAIAEAEAQAKQILNNRVAATGNWDLEGPINTGGRITDLVLSPDNDDVFYAGAATGGIFKTTDRGLNWTPIFDEQTKLSIGDIAIAPSNANVLYVGTGEANGSVNTGAFFGDGVYKTTDAGTTWENVGLPDSQHIGRLVVDPTDEDRVFAAVTGKLYGYNAERGVYRTLNGGTTWEQVLHVTDSTGAIDVAMNPSNTDVIFAAMWERTRKPWQRDYGGVTSAIHRSTDGGDTWEELGAGNGLPAPDGQTGRIGLDVSQSDPGTIYASYTTNQITNVFNGLYKSTDNGDNWTLVALADIQNVNSSFGWYFGNIRVNPANANDVMVLGQSLFRTTNSGNSWSPVNGMHVDHHAMQFSSNDPNFILAGNDGGIYKSENGGSNWTKFTNLPITQFYNIEVDNIDPTRLYGGTQDNNTIRTITGSQNDWTSVWGGDGFHVNVDPVDNNFIYVESQFGNLGRSTDGGNNFQGATDGIDFNDRNNWNTPVIISPFDTEVVYYGTNRLYSSNRAVFWTAISPDLTDGPHPSGSLSYGTLTAIGASYLNTNTIYTGSDDGNVNVTFDEGITWNNISTGLPDRYITSIAVSPSDDLTAYVALSGYQELDYDPHIFKTIDGGQTWNAVAGNLPNIPVNDILVNSTETMLFAATDLNVWYSENDGANWTILGDNLPLTLTRDLKLHEPSNTLYAGTYGRSMHSYDLSQIVLSNEAFTADTNELVVYPVPATSEISLQHGFTSEGTIALYDMTGKQVKSLFSGILSETIQTPINISDISSGIYFLKIDSEGSSVTKKLIVQ